jgi:hypothetical protein
MGSLGLDLSGFTSGMLQAEGLSELFPSVITDFIANPVLALVDVFKEAGEAALEMGVELKDVVMEVGNAAANMSLAAEKAGISIEEFSTLAAVGKTVGVSMESLSAGFKLLQRNAEDAVNGSMPKMAEEFNRLGISTDFLKEHLADPGAIFDAIQRAIQALPDQAERTTASLQLLGRGASDLGPLLNMNKQTYDGVAASLKSLGATEDEQSGKAGRSFLTMTTLMEGAWEGIKKAFSDPILDYFSGNLDSMAPMAKTLAADLRELGGELAQALLPIIKEIVADWPNISHLLDEAIKGIGTSLPGAIAVAAGGFDLLAHTIDAIGHTFGWIAELTDAMGITTGLAKSIYDVSNAAGSLGHDALAGVENANNYTSVHLTSAIKDAGNSFGGMAADVMPSPPSNPNDATTQPATDAAPAQQSGRMMVSIAKVEVSVTDLDQIGRAVSDGVKGPLREALLHRIADYESAAKTATIKAAIGGSN